MKKMLVVMVFVLAVLCVSGQSFGGPAVMGKDFCPEGQIPVPSAMTEKGRWACVDLRMFTPEQKDAMLKQTSESYRSCADNAFELLDWIKRSK